jgi:hypothetical protein
VNVRNDTTPGNGCFDEGIEFFVPPNGQLQMPGRDSFDLEIFASISSQFEDFGGQILENGGCVDSGGRSDAVALVYRVLEETVDATDGELQTGLGGTGLRGLFGGWGLTALATLAAFSTFSGLVW